MEPACRTRPLQQQVRTPVLKAVQSDSEGNYTIVLLPPGTYTIDVPAGVGTAEYENVKVTVGAKANVPVTLTVGTVSGNVVDVRDEGQSVETTRTSISTTVDEGKVINLPTNGRNFLDFAVLAPGVVRDPTRAGDLAVGGQRGTLNSVQIDGASSDNTFFGQSTGRVGSGRAPSEFSIDTVKEFQVNTNGFSAEFGRAAGAVINVVTKSGTNRFTGSAFEYFRDESLNARNPNLVSANRRRPAGQINQFGGTLGGPIKKDRIFFFGAYEGQRSKLPNPVVVNSLPFLPANVQHFYCLRSHHMTSAASRIHISEKLTSISTSEISFGSGSISRISLELIWKMAVHSARFPSTQGTVTSQRQQLPATGHSRSRQNG